MISFVYRNIVEAEEVAVLGDHLARQLHRGLVLAANAEEYPQRLSARESLRSLREQPLARPELRRELLYSVVPT